MKTVSEDRSYIDYTYGDFGVRVWKDHCQAIRRDDASEWVGEENYSPGAPARFDSRISAWWDRASQCSRVSGSQVR